MSEDRQTSEEETSPEPVEATPATDAAAAARNAEPRSDTARDAGDQAVPASDDGEAETKAGRAGAGDERSDVTPAARPRKQEGFISRHFFSLLAVVLVVELFVYGRRGELEVCVAKDRIHDFALLGQERTDANRWRFPTCETRTNLSMMSHYEEAVSEAKKGACRRATQLSLRGQAPQCIKSADGWQFRVNARQVWPWEKPFYRTMLHLD